jgi:fatty-acyl-CoA synthase
MRMLVTAPSDRNSDYVGMARRALAGCPDLRELVFLPAPGGEGPDGGVAPLGEAELTYAELLKGADAVAHSALRARMAELDPHDPINLQYTSGTTGFPKGATLTHHNILNNGYAIGELLGYTEHDRVVIPVPFYHCFGMVIGNLNALSHGAATIIPGRGFSPAAALESVQDFGGTSLYGVPTMFIAELALPDFTSYDLATLRTGGGHETGHLGHAHEGRGHLLRHDRNLAGVHHDPAGGHAAAPDGDGGPHHAAAGKPGYRSCHGRCAGAG